MKKIIKLYNKFVFAIVLACGMLISSCTDFLTIIPPSVIVHENFWHTKAEVNGMVATAYMTMFNTSAMKSSIIWGESRAETVTLRTNREDTNIEYLMEGLLYDDNSYASWSTYYNVINYCNLVLEYGPTVMDHDPNFSEGDMQVVRGQMLALRAMAHFYLVRAFCDIPMSMKAVINDAEIPEYHQVDPLTALNTIYADLEEASHLVLKSGLPSSENLGRITTNAVYALMADVDMWRAAFASYYLSENSDYVDANGNKIVPTTTPDEYYDKAIAHCQYILDEMQRVQDEDPMNIKEKKYAYGLIQNTGETEIKKYGFSSAYADIFGREGNSKESILEFQITKSNYAKNEHGFAALYGTEGKIDGATLVVEKHFLDDYFAEDDLRKYAFTTKKIITDPKDAGDDIAVVKYTALTTSNKENGESDRTFRAGDEFEANWIIYRKTDIMLMQAEAILSRTAPTADEMQKAFNMTKTIYNRWMMDTTALKRPLQLDSNAEKADYLKIVREERARELCFEAKRWYDVVRMALQGEATDFSYKNKTTTEPEEMERRYNHISAYFMPISKTEMRFNSNLVQNRSCRSSDDSAISKD